MKLKILKGIIFFESNTCFIILKVYFKGVPRGVMVKAMDCIVVRVRSSLLRSLSGKYPWERYEPPYPPSYGLNSTTTVLLG